ncbi:Nuclear cap-binding protein subunit 2 [Thelohanellus kitauei]|uniref:Nuclear cap-binding protein subunit 2 n=1 Tax=Thelohanellus kitauei TaxID=669202 RepID=A0A0C2M9F6_THEKT|nr:Nuclear cap-binding protein subunit 2 [Thelohanellus kitauei]
MSFYKRRYRDRDFAGPPEELERKLAESTTVYVGNLSFYVEESQIYAFFSIFGPIKSVIMGLNRNTKTPCGFCFVVFYRRCHAESAASYISAMMLNNRLLTVDIDAGFEEGRQYGRGNHGGQIQDERRTIFDEERGGYAKFVKRDSERPS